MTLAETINMMVSGDWRQRLRSEYYQTIIRHNKLKKFIMQVRGDPGNYPNVSIDLLLHQAKLLEKLEEDLRIRCELQRIDILSRDEVIGKE